MPFWIGTSGYSYKEWKGSFYPEKLPANKMLSYYAGHFSTVEINATFYRMPSSNTLANWAREVPEGFRFTLKAPQRITHRERLKDSETTLRFLMDAASHLGRKLGPVLFQLPPYFKQDLSRLESFLSLPALPEAAVFEFRHPSWFCDSLYDLLKRFGAALCIVDSDEGTTPMESTSDFGYLRLRKQDYKDEEIRKWADRLIEYRAQWKDTYIYLKHEEAPGGAELAKKLDRILEAAI